MSHWKCIFLFLIGLILCSSITHAKELRWTFYGLRPLGMGNAFVAVSDDYNALFYNPAGLALIKEWDGELLNPIVTFSQNTYKFTKELIDLSSSKKEGIEGILNTVEDQIGRQHFAGVGMVPHLIFPNFGLAISIDLRLPFLVHRGSIELGIEAQTIAPIAMAKSFLEDRLSIGVGIKYIAHASVIRELGINEFESLSKSSTTKIGEFVAGGTGIGVDTGLLFRPIDTMEPTLGISMMDVGGTAFKEAKIDSSTTLGRPPVRPPALNTGFSLKPFKSKNQKSYVLVAVDAHAINQPVHYSKKFNLGCEWGYGQFLKLQSGLYQGYLTAGIQLDVKLLNLRIVTYQEDLGSAAGIANELSDRRYALQFKLLI